MSDYKRLTERRGGLVIDNCGNCPNVNNPQGCADKNCYEIMKNRLAELEDKIMDGTLVELPCKVGGTAWFIITYDKLIYIDKIGTIEIGKFSIFINGMELGTQSFLTKAEAEAKLKELQEGGDN